MPPSAPVPSSPAPSLVEPEIARLKALQRENRHPEALAAAEALLGTYPEYRDLLLVAAVSQRHLVRLDAALQTLDRLERLDPRASLVHQERGLCLVAQRNAPAAIEALLRAVNLNPALPTSWRMLEGVYRIVGDDENARTAAGHVAMLRALPPEVVAATSLFWDGEILRAEAIIRGFLLRQGDHPEGMRLLAKIGVSLDVLDDAELLLEGVLALAPEHRAARYDYADVLVKRQKYLKARPEIDALLAQDPANPDYRTLAATIAVGTGDHARAIAIYEALRRDFPASWDVPLWHGHALKTVGRVAEAVEAYGEAANNRPNFGDAYWSLANLKTFRFEDETVERMRREEASPLTGSEDRANLCFALGKALEDRGQTEESWRWYARGNALKRAESRYRPEIIEANTRQQIEVCTRAFFEARDGWGAPAPDPIFILGLPRSGSTLLEQILASHSEVEGTQELPDIHAAVIALQGRDHDPDHPRYPGVLAEMGRSDFVALGEGYLADTRVHRSGKRFFIDKMPNNFRHIGLIHLMLPKARIIDARREPMACCFSNLKQLFAQGQEFTYSAEDIGRYYRTYLELMRHWDAVLPGRVLRVQHEDVVADLEGSVRRMLDYCGLAFEPACVEFHKTRRSVRTPSAEQVRQPIFRDSLDQWKAYEPWLGELKAALGDAVERYQA